MTTIIKGKNILFMQLVRNWADLKLLSFDYCTSGLCEIMHNLFEKSGK